MNYKKSTIGNIDANKVLLVMYLISMLLCLINGACYFAWSIPFLVYVLESKNQYVRKQSAQATMLFIIASIFFIMMYLVQLAIVPVTYVQYADITLSSLRIFLSGVLSTISLIGTAIVFMFSIIAMIRIYNYVDYEIPILGNYIKHFRKIIDLIAGNVGEECNDEFSRNGDSSQKKDTETTDCNIIVGELIDNEEFTLEKKVKTRKGKSSKKGSEE